MKGILPDFFKNVADYIGLPYEFVICKDRNEYIWYQSHTDSIDIAIDARVSDAIIEKNHSANLQSCGFLIPSLISYWV